MTTNNTMHESSNKETKKNKWEIFKETHQSEDQAGSNHVDSNHAHQSSDIVTQTSEELAERLAQVESELAQCKEKIEAYHEEIKRHETQHLYDMAALKTQRVQAIQDEENAANRALKSVFERLLQVSDNLERSLDVSVEPDAKFFETLRTGVEMTLKLLQEVFDKFSVKVIDPVVMKELFDPRIHEAISTQPDDTVLSNTVLKVLRKGYRLRDQIIRPAMVVVSKPSEKNSDQA
jgi:molecular chaperone GrpE